MVELIECRCTIAPKAVDGHRRWTVQKRIAVVVVILAAVLVVGSIARTQSSDPWIGTWRVNLEKSTYSPGPKPTVAATVKSNRPRAASRPLSTERIQKASQPTRSPSGALTARILR
jgi:hypothetical protein